MIQQSYLSVQPDSKHYSTEHLHKWCVFPHGIVRGRAICASADNVDKKVDTYDGKNSFHGMASSVYQQTCDGDTLVEPLDLYDVVPGSLVGVPNTCIQLAECDITGNPKPKCSPSYEPYKVGLHGEHFENALSNDIAWMTARYINRSSNSTLHPEVLTQINTGENEDARAVASAGAQKKLTQKDIQSAEVNTEESHTEQTLPVWSAYNSLVTSPQSDDNAHRLTSVTRFLLSTLLPMSGQP